MISSRYYSASRLGTDAKPRTAMVLDDDDDLYGGFNEVAPALDTRNLRDDQAFQETLKTAGIGKKMPSRMGTGFGFGSQMFRPGTVTGRSSRAGTAAARPVTAVRAAGYMSASRDTPTREEKKEDSIEDRIKQMENRIMGLVEESCMLSARPVSEDQGDTPNKNYDLGQALSKAQEASTLERQLIRMQEQANLGDSHNLDLTFAVLCNLAGQYALNEMYSEALNTYQLLTRNKLFPHANRLKVNMGNIYFKMGEHPKALKLYRMALDQTPTAEKDLRMKVMHNIGLLLVRMGKFRDAVTNFQHIMNEQGDFQTGLHLVLCSVALNDENGGKAAFHAMLDVEPATCHQDVTVDDENDAYESVLRDVLRQDKLSRWSRHEASDAERCLSLAAAALVKPSARDDDTSGMSWCVEALRGCGGCGGSAAGAVEATGARLQLGGALAGLRGRGAGAGRRALARLRGQAGPAGAAGAGGALRAEAGATAAALAAALGNWSEAKQLAEAASRDDPYSCPARVTAALAGAQLAVEGAGQRAGEGAGQRAGEGAGEGAGQRAGEGAVSEAWAEAAEQLAAACQLDPSDIVAMHNLAIALEKVGDESSLEAAAGRWSLVRGAAAGAGWRALAAAGLARLAARAGDLPRADHWYSMISGSGWEGSVCLALGALHAGRGPAARAHYLEAEAAWPAHLAALRWLAAAEPARAQHYYTRAMRLQPNHPEWGLLLGGCLRTSGRYQEALALYKKMNTRFPDNVECLKHIVKLCGDQGLSETSAWATELQRAQARLKQQERSSSVTSAGSSSSGTSPSPIDQFRGAGGAASRVGSAAVPADSTRSNTHAYNERSSEGSAHSTRPLHRSSARNKPVDNDDDLPLPPE